MKRASQFIIFLLSIPISPLFAEVNCETIEFYFSKLPELHFSLTQDEMKSYAVDTARDFIERLQLGKKNDPPFISKNKHIEDDYGDLCEFMLSFYKESKDQIVTVKEITDYLESYLKETIAKIEPYTNYLDEKYYELMNNQLHNEKKGLGIRSHARGADSAVGPFQIFDVIPGSVAEERGLQVEDIILKINDLECEGMQEIEFIECLAKQEGSFSMTILRGEEILYLPNLFLRKFHLPSVRGHFINDKGLAYIRIAFFSEKTGEEMEEIMKAFTSAYGADLRGIIIDLRGNGGGSARGAVEATDTFIDTGIVTSNYVKGYLKRGEWEAPKKGDMTDAPVIVMIDAASASGAELMTSALQDYGRVVVVGTRSYGKGTILSMLQHSDGTAGVIYTWGVFYRPTGETVQLKGVIPDIEIRDPKVDEAVKKMKEENPDMIMYMSDNKKYVTAAPIPRDFEPAYHYRNEAKSLIESHNMRADFSKFELKDIQLSKTLDLLKLWTKQPIEKAHFFVHLYPRPFPKLYINTDLFTPERQTEISCEFLVDNEIITSFSQVLDSKRVLSLKDTAIG
ncbi:MAG: S41 family peptidase, partial [Deltaproteobacteria bacterium]